MSKLKSTALITDYENPLSPLDGERPGAHAALIAYYELGGDRSLVKLCTSLGRPAGYVRTLQEWSAHFRWQERVALQQGIDARTEAKKRAEIRARRRQQLEDHDWEHGETLRKRLLEIVAEMPKFVRRSEKVIEERNGDVLERTRIVTTALNATPGDMARALLAASQLQHQATDAHLIVEEQLEAALDRLRDVLDEETYAQALAAIAGVDRDKSSTPAA